MPRPAPIPVKTNAFASNTMKVRVPDIFREVLELNPDYSPPLKARIQALIDEVAGGEPVGILPFIAHDYEAWLHQFQQQAAAYPVFTWHNCDWFFAENYVYRRLMEAVRYFETGRDPFQPKKQLSLDNNQTWELVGQALEANEPSEEVRLHRLLSAALWGNRIDLSYAASQAHGAALENEEDLLVDSRAAIVMHLKSLGTDRTTIGGNIHIVLDNTGTEFALDLVLVDSLLRMGASSVTLHVKAHPCYVSDVIVEDVWAMLAAFERRGERFQAVASRLRQAWEEGRLHLAAHLFWNSSYFIWEMPSALLAAFEGASLIITKGDVNYRRLLGNAIWPTNTPFSIAGDVLPAPLAALRVLKSDPVIGLAEGVAEKLEDQDPDWRIDGKYGVIQFDRNVEMPGT